MTRGGQDTSGPRLRANLDGRRVLVTGGSRGIAGAIARALAGNGARIGLNYCAEADARAGIPDAAKDLLEDFKRAGTAAVGLEADLTVRGAAADLATRALAAMGGVDIVVLSASVQIHKDFLDQTEAESRFNCRSTSSPTSNCCKVSFRRCGARAGAASSPSAACRRRRLREKCRSTP